MKVKQSAQEMQLLQRSIPWLWLNKCLQHHRHGCISCASVLRSPVQGLDVQYSKWCWLHGSMSRFCLEVRCSTNNNRDVRNLMTFISTMIHGLAD